MRVVRGLLLLAMAVVVVRCSGSPASPPPTPPPVQRFATLSQRVDVLKNLELAYKLRRPDKIDQLLDSHYVFFISGSDLGLGYPAQWDRAAELKYTSELLDPHKGFFDFTTIAFHLELDGPLQWEAIASPDTIPGETWYRAGVSYDFTFELDTGGKYYNTGSLALFIVRNAGTTSAPHWQLAMKGIFSLSCLPLCAPPP
jgi:hypothetical protein